MKIKGLQVFEENLEKSKEALYKLKNKVGQIYRSNIERKEQKNKEFIDSVLKDLQENHNHSWYDEIYLRNKDTLDDIALFYRGTEVSYREMFEKMNDYAKSLRSMGIGEDSEIPVCISNTPEFVYLLGAASIIGAKVNVFAHDFDPDYLAEIINGCNCDTIFVEDNNYESIKNVIGKTKIKNVVMSSLTHSLSDKSEQYKKYNERFSQFTDTTAKYLNGSSIISIDDFVEKGKDYSGIVKSDNVGLDNEFTVTYSSGTTSNRPKQIVHTTRSFITIGRGHDPEIQKTTSMKNFTVQAVIPTFSNTDIISSISDSLMQGSKVALEPIYDKDFFIDSLEINRPNYVVATKSFWVETFKKIFFKDEYKDRKMPYLVIPFAVGEGMDLGEEKFINKGLRKVSAGRDKIPSLVSPITMSVAGGDCEHGGIFWLLFRALRSKLPGNLFKKEAPGMQAFQMVEYAVLDENGNHLPPYQYGRLVANSPCTMKEYKNNPEATEAFFIKDVNGKTWADCSVYSYIDNIGGIHMKGRIPKDKGVIPEFLVSDTVGLDTKNIMSCETINVDGIYNVHVEFQPFSKKDKATVLLSAISRLEKALGKELSDKVVFTIHGLEGFILTHSGKRDTTVLKNKGLENSIRPVRLNDKDKEEVSFIDGENYILSIDNDEKRLLKK